MNFVSYQFWAVLLCALLIYGLCRVCRRFGISGALFDRVYLLATSLLLFGLEDFFSLVLFILIGTWLYFWSGSERVLRSRSRFAWTLIPVAAGMPLLWFKYAPLIMGRDAHIVTFTQLAIPIGLSFYSFQLISFYVDQKKTVMAGGTALRPPWLDFANYASFFPQIVAGPIERRDSLLPQLEAFRFKFSAEDVSQGVKMLILGFFYKLAIANSLSDTTGWAVRAVDSPWLIHLANVAFGLRIYFDFCGYSLIAIGIGRIFGVRLSDNFSAPYIRRNIQTFWQHWHITLTQWFRDYVYIPLGGRGGVTAVIAVFLISGIWHGAGFNFVIWGLLHGIGLVVYLRVFRTWKIPAFLGWGLNMVFVSVTWLFFYQWEMAIVWQKLLSMGNPFRYLVSPVNELLAVCGGMGDVIYLAFSLALAIGMVAMEFLSHRFGGDPYQIFRRTESQFCMVIAIILFSPASNNGFVYFNF